MAVQRDKVIASAEKLVARGKVEPAIKEYERLLDDNPNDVNTLNRIGDLWVRINRNDEAVKVFSKIADHYGKDGFFLKAIAIYKKINKLDPSKLEIYAKLADLYAKQGLAMEAKSQYQVLADYYLKHGEPGNALAIYRKISELDPQAINVHVKLADLYSQNNQPAEALKEYDRVGRMLLKRGMLDEAVQVFRKALKIDPRNTDLVESLVTALLEAKDYENARLLVETALEANSQNARLLSMLGKIQLGRGDVGGARSTFESALAADPNDNAVRESLADLYVRQNDADGALNVIAPLVERLLGRGERAASIEMLNRILRVQAGHAPTLERLVAVYVRLNEETNILAAMNSLAEAHIARMNFDEAAKTLEKLIQREPQNAQHRTKLQFVRSQMGGLDTMPVRGKAATPVMPAMEIDEPVPSFEIPDEPTPDFALDLDASEPIELDLSDARASEPPPVPPPPPHQHLVPAVEIAAAEISDGNDDLDFITEHLTEAEVFAKYGLAEKAAEHLRAVIDRAPKNLTAHERLFRILIDEGEGDAAVAAARGYIALLEEKGDSEAISTVREEIQSHGYQLEPKPAPPAAAKKPAAQRPAAAASAPTGAITLEDIQDTAEEITFDLESGPSEIEFEVEEPEMPLEAEELTLEEVIPEQEPEPEPEVMEAESLVEEPSLLIEEEPEEEVPLMIEEEEEEVHAPLMIEEEPGHAPLMIEEESDQATLLIETETEQEFSLPDEPALLPDAEELAGPLSGLDASSMDAEELPLEEIGEIDFYIEQELFDEARGKLDLLLERFPGNPDLELRATRVDQAVAAAASTRPAAISRDEIESELLSAIPDDEEEITAPPPPPPPRAKAAPPPPVAATTVQEENLFADEDNFFDLAAELESELVEDEEPIALAEEEQSLEEIFKEFKRGVEQQLDSEDYDTHYNLGIAYKEMGLIDEAIGEFQLASKDPKRAVECASMLGLCFLEKGMPQLAIKWYRKGIEIPEVTEDEHVGLLYDLGSAYQEVGDTEQAQKAFLEVYSLNTSYRDIVSRIKQLEDARK